MNGEVSGDCSQDDGEEPSGGGGKEATFQDNERGSKQGPDNKLADEPC